MLLVRECTAKLLQYVKDPMLYLSTDGSTIHLRKDEQTVKIRHRKIYMRMNSEYYSIGVEPDETRIFVKKETAPVYLLRSVTTHNEEYLPFHGKPLENTPPEYPPYEKHPTYHTEYHYHTAPPANTASHMRIDEKIVYEPKPPPYTPYPRGPPYKSPEKFGGDARYSSPHVDRPFSEPPPYEEPAYSREPGYSRALPPEYRYPPVYSPSEEPAPQAYRPYADKPRFDTGIPPPARPRYTPPPAYAPPASKRPSRPPVASEIESDTGASSSPFDIKIVEDGNKIIHLAREGNSHCLNYIDGQFLFKPCHHEKDIIRFRVLERDSYKDTPARKTSDISDDVLAPMGERPEEKKYAPFSASPHRKPMPRTPIKYKRPRPVSMPRIGRMPAQSWYADAPDASSFLPDESTHLKYMEREDRMRPRYMEEDDSSRIISPSEYAPRIDLGTMTLPNYSHRPDHLYNSIKNNLKDMETAMNTTGVLKVPRYGFSSYSSKPAVKEPAKVEFSQDEEEMIEKELQKWNERRRRARRKKHESFLEKDYHKLDRAARRLERRHKKQTRLEFPEDSDSHGAESESEDHAYSSAEDKYRKKSYTLHQSAPVQKKYNHYNSQKGKYGGRYDRYNKHLKIDPIETHAHMEKLDSMEELEGLTEFKEMKSSPLELTPYTSVGGPLAPSVHSIPPAKPMHIFTHPPSVKSELLSHIENAHSEGHAFHPELPKAVHMPLSVQHVMQPPKPIVIPQVQKVHPVIPIAPVVHMLHPVKPVSLKVNSLHPSISTHTLPRIAPSYMSPVMSSNLVDSSLSSPITNKTSFNILDYANKKPEKALAVPAPAKPIVKAIASAPAKKESTPKNILGASGLGSALGSALGSNLLSSNPFTAHSSLLDSTLPDMSASLSNSLGASLGASLSNPLGSPSAIGAPSLTNPFGLPDSLAGGIGSGGPAPLMASTLNSMPPQPAPTPLGGLQPPFTGSPASPGGASLSNSINMNDLGSMLGDSMNDPITKSLSDSLNKTLKSAKEPSSIKPPGTGLEIGSAFGALAKSSGLLKPEGPESNSFDLLKSNLSSIFEDSQGNGAANPKEGLSSKNKNSLPNSPVNMGAKEASAEKPKGQETAVAYENLLSLLS
ncbi:uncharacterized protein NEMAJ01_0931 [Nematocida major]|uniref:uncharacterized protein n=1 Tax=Nematocida major TaxID=1912982 RepID=UPI0020088531|nr:uncharacterized protein NEMAJ01_0931 [Nematocida major]KAH9386035.1 hypothetical protein NEMAJ01_0931 [Nematocida major]